jgi:hypothetical protein
MISGRLTLDENRCVVVESDVSAGRRLSFLIAFSDDGTSWDEGRQAIRIPGRTLRVGETVRLDGSEASLGFNDWTVPPADRCRHLPIWLVGL